MGEQTREELPNGLITGIGSLPHHNIDAALEFAFRFSLPFLPQIPIRNPWEYMIPQALEGIPGLETGKDGIAVLDFAVWNGRAKALNDKLNAAFADPYRSDAFENFEPSAASSSCWHPFLWEIEERKSRFAKVQITGPLTAGWVLRLKDLTPADRNGDISSQVYRLVLARALAMSRRLRQIGVQPVVYLDEPGLFGLNLNNPRHVVAIQQLKLMIQMLKKDGAWVGLHCCSNTDWKAIFSLGLDILSFDTSISLSAIMEEKVMLDRFLQENGRLSLGLIPTDPKNRGTDPGPALTALRDTLDRSIFTPACGLALNSPEDAEVVLSTLKALRATEGYR